ncbi:MAG: cache domain-containing protein [Bacteroidia bacterium]
MAALTPKSRQSGIIITTVILLAVAFTAFFFIYVPAQSEALKARNFRVLAKITENFKRSYEVLQTNAGHQSNILKMNLDPEPEEKKDQENQEGLWHSQVKYSRVNWASEEQRHYTDKQSRKALNSYLELNARKTVEEACPVCTICEERNLSQQEQYWNDSLVHFTNRTRIRISRLVCESETITDAPLKHDEFEFATLTFKDGNNWMNLLIYADAGKFFQPLLQQEVFDSYLIFNEKGNVVYNELPTDVRITNKDSLLLPANSRSELLSGVVKEVEIGGSRYQMFVQPFKAVGEERWMLCGLTKVGNFASSSMHISTMAIIVLLILVTIGLLSLPFLKLKLLSKSEQLKKSDITIAGVSLIVGIPIVMLLTLQAYRYMIIDKQDSREQLAMLNERVKNNFHKDIHSAIDVLSILDSMQAEDTLLAKNLVNISKAPVLESDGSEPPQQEAISSTAQLLPGFQMIYWTNGQGRQKVKWTASERNTLEISLAGRDYFNKIKQRQAYRYHGKSIYVESIYSHLSGESSVAVSMPRNNSYDSIVALLAEPFSVFSPVFPAEYGFAIIDQQGEVLFHSDKSKNLQQNLLQEFGNSNALISGISGGSGYAFQTQYAAREHQVFIAPLQELPFYVVTFKDLSNIRMSYAEILSAAIFFIMAHFIYLLLFALILDITTRRFTRLRIREHRFTWLIPKLYKSRAYQLTLANLLLIILLLLLFFVIRIHDPLISMILAFLATTYSTTIVYFNIKRIRGTAIFKKRFLPFTITSISFILLFNLVALEQDGFSSSFFLLILFQLLILLLTFLLPRYFPRDKWTDSYRIIYRLVLTCWLIIVSALPAYIFFKVAYQNEKILLLKYHQVEYAEKLNEWFGKKGYEAGSEEDTLTGNAFYFLKDENVFFYQPDADKKGSLGFIHSLFNDSHAREKGGSIFQTLFIQGRPRFNEFAARSQNMILDDPDHDVFAWEPGKEQLLLNYNFYRNADSGSVTMQNLYLASPFPYGTLLFFSAGAREKIVTGMFIFLTLVGILLLIALIKFILRQVFVDTFFENDDEYQLDQNLIKNIRDQEKLHLLYIGLPGSGKSDYIKEAFAGKRYEELDIVDLGLNPGGWEDAVNQAKNSDADTVVIDHFEYNSKNRGINIQKLMLLEKLMHLQDKRLIIVSATHPLEILEDLKRKPVDENNSDASGEKWDPEATFDRYMNLLNNFYKIYFPLRIAEGETPKVDAWDEDCITLIKEECKHGKYLHRLQNELLNEVRIQEASGTQFRNDEIILKIQSLAKVYYYSIWNSLNKEEKYVLYDVAEDGVVNPKNTEPITRLLKRGLIIHDGSIRVMNKSFRNFILTVVNRAEAMRMEQELKENGTWSKVRVPLLLVILGIALFLFLTQREAYNQVFTFITAFAAGIPLLFKVLSSFPGSKAAGNNS